MTLRPHFCNRKTKKKRGRTGNVNIRNRKTRRRRVEGFDSVQLPDLFERVDFLQCLGWNSRNGGNAMRNGGEEGRKERFVRRLFAEDYVSRPKADRNSEWQERSDMPNVIFHAWKATCNALDPGQPVHSSWLLSSREIASSVFFFSPLFFVFFFFVFFTFPTCFSVCCRNMDALILARS